MKASKKHSLRTRLNSKTTVRRGPGCNRLWNGAKTDKGYGLLHNPSTGNMEYAHRIAYQLEHGPIPETYQAKPSAILHACDNPSCVTISHLVLGNQDLNMKDKVAKGRQNPKGKTRGKNLTQAERDTIYAYLDQGKTGYEIAKLTGRSQQHISHIRKAYANTKKVDGTTDLLKEINRRLSDLLELPRSLKPNGGDQHAA